MGGIQKDRKTDRTKRHGQVYTPSPIADRLASLLGPLDEIEHLLEPAAGDGALVLAVLRRYRDEIGLTQAELFETFTHRFTCHDTDRDALKRLQSNVLEMTGNLQLLAELERNDELLAGLVQRAPSDFLSVEKSIPSAGVHVLANPPYVRAKNLDPSLRSAIRARWSVLERGSIDLYQAFMARWIAGSKRSVFIVPRGVLSDSAAAPLYERLSPYLSQVIDYGCERVFPGISTQVAVLVTSAPVPDDLFDAPVPRPRRKAPVANAPRIYGGVATLADDVFVLPDARQQPDEPLRFTADGTDFEIEPGALRPFIKITNAAALTSQINRGSPTGRSLLYPYDREGGRGVIAEDDFAARYPGAMAWLRSKRDRLAGRDGGKAAALTPFFAFGRSQGLHDLGDRDLIMVPRIVGGASMPVRIDTTALTKTYGAPLIVSGFALDAATPGAERLMEEEFMAYLRAHANPRPGRSEYWAISSNHIRKFLAG